MGRQLDPLEKEFLIKRFRSNPNVKFNDFCEANIVSTTAFKKWLKQYEQQKPIKNSPKMIKKHMFLINI